MSKIERRRTVVTLYQGDLEAQLADLLDKAMAAERAEALTVRRMAQKSEAMELARQHDELLATAEEAAVKVTIWAITNTQWSLLANEHPPREDDAEDKRRGVNMETFPEALLHASLVSPEDSGGLGLEALLTKGADALAAIGDISRVQYVKLERAAWNVNVGDDALPKYSLVSLLREQRDPDSKPQPDSA